MFSPATCFTIIIKIAFNVYSIILEDIINDSDFFFQNTITGNLIMQYLYELYKCDSKTKSFYPTYIYFEILNSDKKFKQQKYK